MPTHGFGFREAVVPLGVAVVVAHLGCEGLGGLQLGLFAVEVFPRFFEALQFGFKGIEVALCSGCFDFNVQPSGAAF